MNKATQSIANSGRFLFKKVPQEQAIFDGIRALATLMVIMLHCVYGVLLVVDKSIKFNWVENAPWWLGWAFHARGADIIFLVSAFLVTSHFFKNKKDNIITLATAKQFYWRRLWRIYPLFFVALGIYLLTDHDRLVYWWSNLFFIANLIPEQKYIIPVGWSITLQMQFYVLLPIILYVLFLSRRPIVFSLLLIAAFIGIKAIIYFSDEAIVTTPFYLFYSDPEYPKNFGELIYYSLPARISPFLMGITLALMAHFYQLRWVQWSQKNQTAVLSLWVFATLCLLVPLLIPMHQSTAFFYEPLNQWQQGIYQIFHRSIFSLGVSIMVWLLLTDTKWFGWLKQLLCWRCWRPLSQMIYPLYLFHFIGIVLAALVLFGDKAALEAGVSYTMLGVLFLLAVPISFLLALPFYLLVERPFINLSR